MGRRGPAPKPTALKILAGWPGHGPRNKREPNPPPGVPECPANLSKPAREKWHALAPLLVQSGLLAKLDSPALAMLCNLLVRIDEAEKQLAKFGLLMKGENAYPVVSPYFYIVNRAQRDAMRIMAEFGLTPSSRSRIHAERGLAESEVVTGNERFFRGN